MTGQTNLLTSWEETQESLGDGFRRITISSGEPHTRAIFAAVVDRYNAVSGRDRPTTEELELLIGNKVTIVSHGENFLGGGILAAHEGKLFASSRGGLGMLPKGARTKGFRVQNVLDVFAGYSTEEAVEMVRKVRSHFPTLKRLTQERLPELPSSSKTLSLCVFGSYRMPDSTATDALYLVSNYLREDDIIEGVLLIRPEHGFSEHGSIWGRQLLGDNFGEVMGFKPISFAEGIELCDLDFDQAYERVVGATRAVA